MVGKVKTKQNGIDQTRLKISWSKIFYRALLEIYYCYTVHKPITNHLQTVSFTSSCLWRWKMLSDLLHCYYFHRWRWLVYSTEYYSISYTHIRRWLATHTYTYTMQAVSTVLTYYSGYTCLGINSYPRLTFVRKCHRCI